MTQQDLDYRKIHAVVPQLDFSNGGYDNIVAPPVRYTKYVSIGNITKVSGTKIAGGAVNILEGAVQMGGGDFIYGLGKTVAGIGKTVTGVVNPADVAVKKYICDTIRGMEQDSWKEKFFLIDFVPAEGCLGDIVCADGEYHEKYCGLGHQFFENGDYFEGRFVDGRIYEGIYIFANGARYLGMFDESLNFTGVGTILYADGTFYHGVFEQSLRTDVGAMWYKDGVYVGRWSNDMRHGDGVLRVGNKIYEGDFENDKMVGKW